MSALVIGMLYIFIFHSLQSSPVVYTVLVIGTPSSPTFSAQPVHMMLKLELESNNATRVFMSRGMSTSSTSIIATVSSAFRSSLSIGAQDADPC